MKTIRLGHIEIAKGGLVATVNVDLDSETTYADLFDIFDKNEEIRARLNGLTGLARDYRWFEMDGGALEITSDIATTIIPDRVLVSILQA